MRRTFLATVVASAALLMPGLARANAPGDQPPGGYVTGMSELPARVQDAVEREARRSGNEIHELRIETDGTFSAQLGNGHGERVSFDDRGDVVSRRFF